MKRRRAGLHLARDLDAPVRAVVGDLELDLRRLHAQHLTELGGEVGGPTAGLAAEDGLHRLALALVTPRSSSRKPMSAVVPSSQMLPSKSRDRREVEPVEGDVAEVALVDVPDEHSVAVALRGRLGEGARAGDRALADVEPVPAQMPTRNVGHGAHLHRARRLARLRSSHRGRGRSTAGGWHSRERAAALRPSYAATGPGGSRTGSCRAPAPAARR